MYLFIDTTQNITVGLLSSELSWVEYQYLESKKSSAEIHLLIFELLKKHNLKVAELSAVIYSAGPGSYTGMRVSEGITNIFEWQDITVYSFYHFKIPGYAGIDKGVWIAKAFKGEFFFYEWNSESFNKKLIEESDLGKYTLNKNLFSGHEAVSEQDTSLTYEMIKKNPVKIFKKIISDEVHEDLYYYRSLEEEFKRN